MTPDKQAVETEASALVERWQEARSEWFNRDVREIVRDFAEWHLAALAHPVSGDVEGLLEKHIQRCRDAIAKCPKWSAPQAEWSRARDALLNFRDDLEALARGEGM